jgi:zinc protease
VIVLCEEKHDLPLVHVDAVLPVGASLDLDGQEGLSRHASELMRRGAGGRSRAELDAALDSLGASLDVDATQDEVVFSGKCLARNLEPFVALLGDVLGRPHLDAEEHEKLRRESLALLDEIRDDDSSLCGRFFERACLSGHPYGRTAIGTESSLAKLSRDDAAAWVSRNAKASHAIVGFAGDVEPARARELAERATATMLDGAAPERPILPAPALRPSRRTVLVDKPERQQSQILIGHGAPRHADPDWLPLHVGATVFGGMFTSRLMTEVRVKRGWSYGAGCRVGRARGGHAFRIRVFPSAEQTPDCLALVLEMWEQITAQGISDEELAFAKAYLEGNFAFEIDTPEKRVSHAIDELVYELPPGTYETFLDRLRSVGRDQVNAAIQRWWHPARAVIVVTATAETMKPRLEKLPIGTIDVMAYDSY